MSRVGNTVGSNKSRKDTRAVVTLVARYRSPTTFEYANEACFDISVGGMFIKSAAPAPAGTLLKLECETDENADVKIRGVARVVWLRREANEHGPSGMGVKFVKLEPGSRELIENIVQRLADAGVQARSVSAAPEQQAAAASAAASAGRVQLVQSTPPEAPEPAEQTAPAAGAPTAANVVAAAAVAPASEPTPNADPVAQAAARAPAAESKPEALEREPAAMRTPAAEEPAEPVAAAVEPRPSSRPTGSSRPPAPKPSRFGAKYWVLGIAVVLIVVAIVDRRSRKAEETPVTPEASEPAEPKAPAPATAAPKEPPATPPAGEMRQNVAPTTPEPPPAAAAPAEAKAEPAAPAPSAAEPAAAASEPLYPLKPNGKAFVIEFVSRPNEAEVTIDDKLTLTTPQEVNMGGMPDRVKVTAKKAGYKSSSIWLPREGFELKDGVLRKRVYLTLKADSSAP